MDRETWQATVHGVAESDTTKRRTCSLLLDFSLLEVDSQLLVGWLCFLALAWMLLFTTCAEIFHLCPCLWSHPHQGCWPHATRTLGRVGSCVESQPHRWGRWGGGGLPHGLGTPLGAQLFGATCLKLWGCSHLLPEEGHFERINLFFWHCVLYWSMGGGHDNPLQYSCLENPMDRGAWWATVHGLT